MVCKKNHLIMKSIFYIIFNKFFLKEMFSFCFVYLLISFILKNGDFYVVFHLLSTSIFLFYLFFIFYNCLCLIFYNNKDFLNKLQYVFFVVVLIKVLFLLNYLFNDVVNYTEYVYFNVISFLFSFFNSIIIYVFEDVLE
jgi:hypothetical protein